GEETRLPLNPARPGLPPESSLLDCLRGAVPATSEWLPPLDHADQHHDDRDHQQDVDQASQGVRRQEAEQPENDENGDDGHHVRYTSRWKGEMVSSDLQHATTRAPPRPGPRSPDPP